MFDICKSKPFHFCGSLKPKTKELTCTSSLSSMPFGPPLSHRDQDICWHLGALPFTGARWILWDVSHCHQGSRSVRHHQQKECRLSHRSCFSPRKSRRRPACDPVSGWPLRICRQRWSLRCSQRSHPATQGSHRAGSRLTSPSGQSYPSRLPRRPHGRRSLSQGTLFWRN